MKKRKPYVKLASADERRLRLEAYAEVERLDSALHKAQKLQTRAEKLAATAKVTATGARRREGRTRQEIAILRRVLADEKRAHAETRGSLRHAVQQLARKGTK